MATVRFIGPEERWFETAVTGSQQMWRRGQVGFVPDVNVGAFIATGKFERYERDPVFEQANQVIDQTGQPLGGGGAQSAILAMAAASPLRMPVRSFKNSWTNYPGTAGTPLTVTVAPTGLLEYSGLIKPNAAFASGQVVCELPVGFAPDYAVRSPMVLLDANASNQSKPAEAVLYGIDTAIPTLNIETIGTGVTSMPLVGASARAYTSAVRAAIYWRNTTDSDDVCVVVPPAALVPGATIKVAIWCHGAADDYLSLFTDPNTGASSNRNRPITMGLLNDGWIIVNITAKSTTHWGNPGAWAAEARGIDWIKSWLTIDKMVAIGQSMGGTLSLRACAAYPEITNWYGIYPAASLTVQYTASGNAYQNDIITAYTPYGGYAANLTQCSPVDFPAGAFAGKRLLCTASTGDSAVPKAGNADAIVAKALADGAQTASVTATTGGHGDASNFTTPIVTAMLAHLNG